MEDIVNRQIEMISVCAADGALTPIRFRMEDGRPDPAGRLLAAHLLCRGRGHPVPLQDAAGAAGGAAGAALYRADASLDAFPGGVRMSRVIFHVDVNSAFLSWSAAYRVRVLGEQEDLRGIPSAVAGERAERHGIILAKSIPAKKCGVKTGEQIFLAQQKCPGLKLVPPDYALYVEASRCFIALLREFAPVVEQYSIDEAWADLSGTEGLYGSPVAAAELLRLGADNAMVSTVFFRKVSRARLKLESMIYSGLQYFRDGKIAVATITLEMMEKAGATEDDCDDLAGLAGRVEGSILNITIREQEDGSSKISVRSTPEISSSDICAVFGGGGHAMAAGCTIYGKPDKARDMLLSVIDEVWK